jgi:uncharacterized phage infection (PIP) family protein YhgE
MLYLINILIVFFILLLIYQILLANHIVEGMEGNKNEFQEYDKNDPNNLSILVNQNAGNITYLKDRMNNVANIGEQVKDISGNLQTLQEQVNDLVLAQEDYANQLTGGSAPEISGAIDEEGEEIDEPELVV